MAESTSKSFLEKFRRITSSGFYLPQIDGLRFVAIFMVVCIAHIPNYINQKLLNGDYITNYWARFSLDGVFGVMLFFIISGFVLGHRFARKYIHNNEKPDLRGYYLRRLTRMEPPYLLALIIFFIALVFIIKKYSFSELFPHFIASFFYLHNEVYSNNSFIIPVAWTLEIEIQFYLLAPLLGFLYKIKKRELRWLIFLLLIFLDAYYWYNKYYGMHVFKYLHYFLWGMLIADLYVEKFKFQGKAILGFGIGMISLCLLFFVIGYYSEYGYIIKNVSMVVLFYTGLTNETLARFFSFKPLAIIGGMCYSIYLIHEQVISATGKVLKHFSVGAPLLTFVLFYALLLIAVLISSSIYFKFIEQPCMKRNWWKALISKR